jgi:N-acetylglucosamine malate deacetylase 1
VLGIGAPIMGDFPNIQFNTVAHLEIVQFIEQAILDTGATVLFTHHPRDLNNDHLHTSSACQAAARLFQRRDGVPPLRAVYFMEVPSSTDWALSGHEAFRPDTFYELTPDQLERKVSALATYRNVMRPPPHPRSREVLEALATCRGGQSGVRFAEAFQTAFRRLDRDLHG